MKEILEALSATSPNAERKLYTILTGNDAGGKILTENGELCRQTGKTDLFSVYQKELETAPENGCFKASGIRIYAEKVGRQPRLVVCGGEHVAVAVIRIAVMMQVHVTVLEDRPLFADHARAAGADRVICDAYDQGLTQISADTDTYFVIVTRGHRYDQICVEQICHMPHAYIGMMGSRRRVAVVKKQALAHGADPKVIASLHAPSGLNIQAETPEEIAVSVMAEIICEKGKHNMGGGFSDEIMKALKEPLNEGTEKVLATIVSRKGSAPRAVGTRMLIQQDGRLTGTIGGGCLEAKVITAARELMAQPENGTRLIKIDRTAEEPEEEGIVCGGILEVFLEKMGCCSP